MATVCDNAVFDGEIKIADIVREPNKYSETGSVLCLTPVGDKSWRKYMGHEIDHDYCSALFACSICHGCASLSFMEPTRTKLAEKRICFGCNFWLERIEADAGEDNHSCVIVDGVHYVMGTNTKTASRWGGFGGHEFCIKFHDGRTVFCNNLWSQGQIPERWRSKLQDNAVFVKATRWPISTCTT